MNEKYLPLGTICRLKDGNKNLMIVGFCQSSADNQNVIYDYNGCMHPEGIFSADINFLFNHDQIEEIVYMGLINQEEINFKKNLNDFLANGTFDGKSINVDEDGNISLGDGEITFNVEEKTIDPKQMVNDTLNRVQTQINKEQPTIEQVVQPIQQAEQTQTNSMFNTLNINDQNNNQ